MAHTSEEIPLPGGVTIEFDDLVKAIKAGKSPEECVKAATVEYKPVEIKPDDLAPAPDAPTPAPASGTTTEKE